MMAGDVSPVAMFLYQGEEKKSARHLDDVLGGTMRLMINMSMFSA